MAVDPFADAETRYRLLVDERRNGGLQARAGAGQDAGSGPLT
jgi:hypothetical protein